MKLFKKAKKGFTLVELVVVIAVIAILAAVSVGAYFGVTDSANRSRLEQEAKQAHTNLRLVSLADKTGNSSLDIDGLHIGNLNDFNTSLNDLGVTYDVENESTFNINSIENPTIVLSSDEYVHNSAGSAIYTYLTFDFYLKDIANLHANCDLLSGKIQILKNNDQPATPATPTITGVTASGNIETQYYDGQTLSSDDLSKLSLSLAWSNETTSSVSNGLTVEYTNGSAFATGDNSFKLKGTVDNVPVEAPVSIKSVLANSIKTVDAKGTISTQYYDGQTLSSDDLSKIYIEVSKQYGDATVIDAVTVTYANGSSFATGDTYVTVSGTFEGNEIQDTLTIPTVLANTIKSSELVGEIKTQYYDGQTISELDLAGLSIVVSKQYGDPTTITELSVSYNTNTALVTGDTSVTVSGTFESQNITKTVNIPTVLANTIKSTVAGGEITTQYYEGDTFTTEDLAKATLTITKQYGNPETIPAETFEYSNGSSFVAGDTYVTVKSTYENEEVSAQLTLQNEVLAVVKTGISATLKDGASTTYKVGETFDVNRYNFVFTNNNGSTTAFTPDDYAKLTGATTFTSYAASTSVTIGYEGTNYECTISGINVLNADPMRKTVAELKQIPASEAYPCKQLYYVTGYIAEWYDPSNNGSEKKYGNFYLTDSLNQTKDDAIIVYGTSMNENSIKESAGIYTMESYQYEDGEFYNNYKIGDKVSLRVMTSTHNDVVQLKAEVIESESVKNNLKVNLNINGVANPVSATNEAKSTFEITKEVQANDVITFTYGDTDNTYSVALDKLNLEEGKVTEDGTYKITFDFLTKSITKAAFTAKESEPAEPEDSNTPVWKLVTDADTLESGNKLIIASNANKVVAGNLSESYLGKVTASFSDSKKILDSKPSGCIEFTLGGEKDKWTFENEVGNLLYCSTVKKLNFSNNGTNTWTISISSDNAIITSTTTSFGSIKYNTQSPRFTTYASGQSAVQLYRLEGENSGGSTPTPTTPTLSSISITGTPKTQYNVGEDFSLGSANVIAKYTNNDTKDVTALVTISPKENLQTSDTSVTISYKEGDITVTTSVSITVKSSETTQKYFEKVTSSQSDWSGTYLIVYESGQVAFNGNLSTLDAASNTVNVTIANNQIVATDDLMTAVFTISKNGSNYTIKSNSGKYIGNNSNSNSLTANDTALYNTISFVSANDITIKGNGGSYLRYNATSGQTRFRYFKSGTYTSQKAIQLYKLIG